MNIQRQTERRTRIYPKKQYIESEEEQGKEANSEFAFAIMVPPNTPQSFKQSINKSKKQIETPLKDEELQMHPISVEKTNIINFTINPIYEEIRDAHKIIFKEVDPDLCKELYTIPVEQRVIYVLQESLDFLCDRQKQIAKDLYKQNAETIAKSGKTTSEIVSEELEITQLEQARKIIVNPSRRSLTFQEKTMITSFILVTILMTVTIVVLYQYGYLN